MRFRDTFRGVLTLAALALLAACSNPEIGPTFTKDAKTLRAETFECCFDPEKYYPSAVAGLYIDILPASGARAAEAAYGGYTETGLPGTLTGKPEVAEAIMPRLRPFDVMVVGSSSYLLGRVVPGRFTHGLVYVGNERQLRAAGLWFLPEIVPHHDDIRAGKTILDTTSPVVRLKTPEKAFWRDRILVARPNLDANERRLAARRYFESLGKPFNFTMGIDPTHETFGCTGLMTYAMPSLNLKTRDIYGLLSILPDDIAAQAIRGNKMEFVTYLLGNEGPGISYRSKFAAMVDIAAYWGIPGTPSAP